MQTGDDQRRVEHAEDRTEEHAEVAGNTCHDNAGDDLAQLPADGSKNEVCRHDCQSQGAEGDQDHLYDLGDHLLKEPLQISKGERCQDRRDDLRLIADHTEGVEAEVPDVIRRPVFRCHAGHAVSVHQLTGDQSKSEDDAQCRGAAHLPLDRPADTDRDTGVEHCFADDPQELVKSGEEGALFQDHHDLQHVAEAEDKTAADDRRNQRGEDLCDIGHCFLQRRLIPFRRLLCRFLGHTFNARNGSELFVEIRHLIADDHLELSGLCECSLDGRQSLDLLDTRLLRVRKHEPHSRDAVCDRVDVFLAADIRQQFGSVVTELSHFFLLDSLFSGPVDQVLSSGSVDRLLPSRHRCQSLCPPIAVIHLFLCEAVACLCLHEVVAPTCLNMLA